MYINDINIFAYVIIAVVGAISGQVCDLLNFLLPKHKKIFSIKSIKEYFKNFSPKYLLMVVHIVIYVLLLRRYGFKDLATILSTLKYMVLTPLLISAFIIDYKLQIIPNRLTMTVFEIGLIFAFIHGATNPSVAINMVQGMMAGGLIFLLITIIGGIIFGKETMGFGDVKLMAALGLFVGYQGIIVIAVLSFLIAALFSVALLIIQKIRHRDVVEYIAFGPFIVIAAIIVMIVPLETIMQIPFVVFSLGKYKI